MKISPEIEWKCVHRILVTHREVFRKSRKRWRFQLTKLFLRYWTQHPMSLSKISTATHQIRRLKSYQSNGYLRSTLYWRGWCIKYKIYFISPHHHEYDVVEEEFRPWIPQWIPHILRRKGSFLVHLMVTFQNVFNGHVPKCPYQKIYMNDALLECRTSLYPRITSAAWTI